MNSAVKQVRIWNYIGFAVPIFEANGVDARLGGSGSLVPVDGLRGILTASHVVRSLQQERIVGLIVTEYGAGRYHRVLFNPNDCRIFEFPNLAKSSAGPDLAFLALPLNVADVSAMKKSFYNLPKRRDPMLEIPPDIGLGVWAISGLAQEWTKDAPLEGDAKRIKSFAGKLLPPEGAPTEHVMAGFDYFTFEAVYGEGYDGPTSFAGYSGSGVWHLLVEAVDGRPRVTQRYLSGVAFYQSDLCIRDAVSVRQIICRGRQSIYRNLLDKVWAEMKVPDKAELA
jgi:hypothetical protein